MVVLCLAPAVGLLLVFLTYPLGLGLWLAFTDTKIGRAGVFVGLDNFDSLFHDRIFWLSVTNTLFYTAAATAGSLGWGCGLALAAEPQRPVQEPDPRDRVGAVDRADGAVRHRVLVDL